MFINHKISDDLLCSLKCDALPLHTIIISCSKTVKFETNHGENQQCVTLFGIHNKFIQKSPLKRKKEVKNCTDHICWHILYLTSYKQMKHQCVYKGTFIMSPCGMIAQPIWLLKLRGMGTQRVQLKVTLPWLARWARRAGTRDFYPALAALVTGQPSTKYFFPHRTLFHLCPFAVYYLRYGVRPLFTIYRNSFADGKRGG